MVPPPTKALVQKSEVQTETEIKKVEPGLRPNTEVRIRESDLRSGGRWPARS